jgi:hypothetical protein
VSAESEFGTIAGPQIRNATDWLTTSGRRRSPNHLESSGISPPLIPSELDLSCITEILSIEMALPAADSALDGDCVRIIEYSLSN